MVVASGSGLGLLWVGCFCFGEEWVGFAMGWVFLFWRRYTYKKREEERKREELLRLRIIHNYKIIKE